VLDSLARHGPANSHTVLPPTFATFTFPLYILHLAHHASIHMQAGCMAFSPEASGVDILTLMPVRCPWPGKKTGQVFHPLLTHAGACKGGLRPPPTERGRAWPPDYPTTHWHAVSYVDEHRALLLFAARTYTLPPHPTPRPTVRPPGLNHIFTRTLVLKHRRYRRVVFLAAGDTGGLPRGSALIIPWRWACLAPGLVTG